MGRGVEGRPVEVVLDDEVAQGDARDAEGPGGAAGAAPSAQGAARRRRRRLGVVGVLLLGLVVVLGVVDARADRRERDALAAAAGVPGVLASLAEPPAELWRLPVFPPIAAAGGVVVLADEPDVVGADLGTGDPLWRSTRPVGSSRPVCPMTIPADDARTTRVACFGLTPGVGGLGVLDPATGELRDFRRASRVVLSSAPVDGDVVTLESARSVLLVTRHDLGAGGERWSVAVDRGETGLGDARLHGDEQVVAIEGATTVVLDARDGSELGRFPAASDGVAPATASVVSRPGRGFGVWESRFAGRWYAPDGTPGPALAGEPVAPAVDDGALPGVVLLRPSDGDRLRAVDVTTGDERWDRPWPGRVLLHLAGRLVVTGDGRLEGWDAATGDVVWSVTLDAGEDPHLGDPYTDGVRVLVRGEDRDAPRLTAYRVADGGRVWRAPLPAGTEYVAVLDDRLAAVGHFDGRAQGAGRGAQGAGRGAQGAVVLG